MKKVRYTDLVVGNLYYIDEEMMSIGEFLGEKERIPGIGYTLLFKPVGVYKKEYKPDRDGNIGFAKKALEAMIKETGQEDFFDLIEIGGN